MAQGILSSSLPHLIVTSAGIGALVGSPADPTAVELMRKKDIDISHHVARQVTRSLCRESDLILVTELDQKRYLETAYPFIRGKVFSLAIASGNGIPDPFRKDIAAFKYALALIEQGAEAWVERIKKLNKASSN